MRIALAGNPNCGKTTLFNALTGAHQRVGNWPGVTVEKKSGEFSHDGVVFEVVDLPGIYSLEQAHLGVDEQIAREFLASGETNLIINVIDASNLQRNLLLTQQLLESGLPMIVALNMLDVAEDEGMRVDTGALQSELGVPVVPLVAARGTGVADLLTLLVTPDALERRERAAAGNGAPVAERLQRRYFKAVALTDSVVEMQPVTHSFTERVDGLVLNRWLGIPFFLLMMYLMFTIAVNVGAVFIDFFDILFGAFLVDLPREALASLGLPEWIIVLLADGLGGGIQLVATFIPVIGALFLCLTLLEDSGYMSRAAFVIDRVMGNIGLPGNAFVPLIVGFGCNVPAVMATRSLGRDSDRLMTIAMAPFMSCGARLTVYALFAAAFFPSNGQNIVFGLYLLGILLAVATGWVFRRQMFSGEITPSFQEMPAYHLPVWRNIFLTTWFRLRGFVVRAGKTIVVVVVCLSFLNSIGTDGSFGNEDTELSALSAVGKTITPIFSPLGLKEENWPATVGLFTGIFAKEAVVGTLDALYAGDVGGNDAPLDLVAATGEAVGSILANSAGLADSLVDPLGIDIGDVSDRSAAADAQGVSEGTLTNMAAMFGSQFAAFCYLVFVLLYAPCVAVLGAVAKEAGWRYMVLIFSWTTALGYITATCLYQVGTFTEHPVFSSAWLVGCALVLLAFVAGLKRLGKRVTGAHLIPVASVS